MAALEAWLHLGLVEVQRFLQVGIRLRGAVCPHLVLQGGVECKGAVRKRVELLIGVFFWRSIGLWVHLCR